MKMLLHCIVLSENIRRGPTIVIRTTRCPTFKMHALPSSSAYIFHWCFVTGLSADDGIFYLLVGLLLCSSTAAQPIDLHQILINVNFCLPHVRIQREHRFVGVVSIGPREFCVRPLHACIQLHLSAFV